MNKKRIPYAPSWVDRLTDWIDNLPFPGWLFYIGLYLLTTLGLHVSNWLNHVAPWGTPSLLQFYSAIWFPLVLFSIHNTDHLANLAMDRFIPLVRKKTAQVEELRYRITTMPAIVILVMYLLSAAMVFALAQSDPVFVLYETPVGPIHPVAWGLSLFFGVTSYAMAPVMVYHGLRQLFLINEVFNLVDKVNVFHQQPLYSFSSLTMRTALFFLAMVFASFLSTSFYDASSIELQVSLTLSVVIVPASLFIVLVPLLGIHNRLAQAKVDTLGENSHQIETAQQRLYQAISKNKTESIKAADAALSSLYRVQEQLKSLSTWPWVAGAFRNFMSAILVPMALWLLQTLVSRFL